MRWLLYAALTLVAAVAIATLVGWLLPVAHHASREAAMPAPPERVWEAITDVGAFPSWRADVERVERLPDREGRTTWAEHTSEGRITLATERSEAPRLLVVRIADPDLPFGGTWTYEIAPAPGGARLRITEDGEIYNPIFRVMARFVFGYEGTIADYLASLQRHLQQTANP
jgi:hypothetical protein